MKESDRILAIGGLAMTVGLFAFFYVSKNRKTCVHLKYEAKELTARFDTPSEAMKYIISKSSETTIHSIQMGPCEK